MGHARDREWERGGGRAPQGNAAPAAKVGAGTLVQALEGNLGAPSPKVGGSARTGPSGGDGSAADAGGDVHQLAAAGIAGGGGPLPHGDAIQRAFGRHDVSGVEAHVGGSADAATRALGAEAYATGQHVAFGGAPSLHTAAHEAAHVVQQRAGLKLAGGVGAAGDAHEQHADAVADAVVAGGSAEELLDEYADGGGGGSEAIQRKERDPAAPDPAPLIDPKVIIAKLDAMPALAVDATQGAFGIDGVAAWIARFVQTLGEARVPLQGAAATELAQAVDRCVGVHAPGLQQAAEQLRAATVQLTNDSSVSKQDPVQAVFPTREQITKLAGDAARLSQLARAAQIPASADSAAALQQASATAQDAALAMLQALSVAAARDRWKLGKATETPENDKIGKGPRTELDDIFKDAHSGLGDRATYDKDKGRVFDWCGIFVSSSYFKGAGIAKQLQAGFNHTDNVQDFFHYEQKHNEKRIPLSIWAEDQWWNLKAYHQARGSVRQWTPRAAIQAALAGGGAADIRPGDTCLIDHKGGNHPSHIVMVESYDPVTKQLVTIEGNTHGIHADSAGKAERVDDDHLKDPKRSGPTAAGLHVRDLSQLAPGPGKYVVTRSKAYVRMDDDVTKFKKEKGKKVQIPVGTAVDVTEIKTVGKVQYANVAGWGWTSFGKLDTTGDPPKGGYKAKGGATVWGVGRPSMVDFEDGHEYAVHQVPEELRTTSPEKMHELAKQKGKQGAQVRNLGLK